MDSKTEEALLGFSAHVTAIEVAICALVAAHPDPKKLARYLDAAAASALRSQPLSTQPARRHFQQCLNRLRVGLS